MTFAVPKTKILNHENANYPPPPPPAYLPLPLQYPDVTQVVVVVASGNRRIPVICPWKLVPYLDPILGTTSVRSGQYSGSVWAVFGPYLGLLLDVRRNNA